jgi:hypothetical protein
MFTQPHSIEVSASPMPLRRFICFLTQHRWGTAGRCLRCHVRCRHAIAVFQPETSSSQCIDCSASVEPGSAVSGQTHAARPPRTLWQSIRHSFDHLFEWENDRWA